LEERSRLDGVLLAEWKDSGRLRNKRVRFALAVGSGCPTRG
jgi:hypothetical protein